MGSGASAVGPSNTASSSSSIKQDQSNDGKIQRAIKQGEELSDVSIAEIARCQSEQPLVIPSTKRKSDIFKPAEFQQLDNRIKKIRNSLFKLSIRQLVNKLIDGIEDESLSKARAIFVFLASMDMNRIPEEEPEINSPLEYLQKVKNNRANLAHLFCALCRVAQVPCQIIGGMNKSSSYSLGKEVSAEQMGAQWNAVHVCEEWRLVDVFWASTCIVGADDDDDAWDVLDVDGRMINDEQVASRGEKAKLMNEFYFLTDPDQMIYTHFPRNSAWQLLDKDTQFSQLDYQEAVYRRERSFELGVIFNSPDMNKCRLTPDGNQITIEFELSDPTSEISFKYMLYMAKAEHRGGDMKKFVMFQRSKTSVKYTATLPTKTALKMDIFGKDGRRHKSYDLVCSYLIDRPKASLFAEKLPDNPAIGWGTKTGRLEAYGIQAVTHEDSEINIDDGEIDIEFKLEDSTLEFQHLLLSNSHTKKELEFFSYVSVNDDTCILHARVPKPGLYACELFCSEPIPSAELQNVCNYLLRCQNKDVAWPPYPLILNGQLGVVSVMRELNVALMEPLDPKQKISTGKIQLKLRAPENITLGGVLDHLKMNPEQGASQISMVRDGEVITFNLDLTLQGEYTFNIFATVEGESRLYNIFNYLIENEVNSTSKETRMVREFPEAETIRVRGTTAELTLAHVEPENIRANVYTPQTISKPSGDIVHVTAENLPVVKVVINLYEPGTHHVEIYENKNGHLIIKKRYVIVCTAEAKIVMAERESTFLEVTNLEGKYKELKERFEKYSHDDDVEGLQSLISEIKDSNFDDSLNLCGLVKSEIAYIHVKKELVEALEGDVEAMMRKAVENGKRVKHRQRLNKLLAEAQRRIERIEGLRKLRHAILNLDQRTISEIKSFASPPAGIFEVMRATLILLGNTKVETKAWVNVVALMGKTGRFSLKRRVTEFDVTQLSPELAREVNDMMNFTLEEVSSFSSGVAVFFKWAKGQISEALKTSG